MLIISSYCRIPLLGFILSPSTPKDDKNLSIYINACQVGDHGEAHDAADEAQDPQEKPCQSTAPPAKKARRVLSRRVPRLQLVYIFYNRADVESKYQDLFQSICIRET